MLLVCGDNRDGQACTASGEDFISQPTPIADQMGSLQPEKISSFAMNQHVTFVVTAGGVLLTAGLNDQQQLGRAGKRSILQRVDAVETFQLTSAAVGAGFAHLICDDGRVISWGANELGQLGNSTRDSKEKPRINNSVTSHSFTGPFLHIACGATHSIAITKSGKMVTWGGNRKGQLGDGQLTSSNVPLIPLQLRHRPVVAVAAGESHCLALTIGGNVYSWGDNTHGQLGLSDTVGRLRPEQVKSLRLMGAKAISAGKSHSLVISQKGLLLTFGANSHGQCGLGSEVKVQPIPSVVEHLRDVVALKACGGASHSVVLCSVAHGEVTNQYHHLRVYMMGLNSCGQLGLPGVTSVSVPRALKLSINDTLMVPIDISSGALSLHSMILCCRAEAYGDDHQQKEQRSWRNRALPSVEYALILSMTSRYNDAVHQTHPAGVHSNNPALIALREMVAAAFASIPVLNASFLVDDASLMGHGKLCIKLDAVRSAYNLLMATESSTPLVINTLSRATLHLAELLKECPFDDAENLSVFLIVLENPLMLRTSTFHVAIEMVVRSVLAIPKYYRMILFRWLKSYSSEYLGRVLQVLQEFMSFAIKNTVCGIDPTPAIMVLETLAECNAEVKILPESSFYNNDIARYVNLEAEWLKLQHQGTDSTVFNYWSYPFLIDVIHKYNIIHFDFERQKNAQINIHIMQYQIDEYLRRYLQQHQEQVQEAAFAQDLHLPQGIAISIAPAPSHAITVWLELKVSRQRLLPDLLDNLEAILTSDPNSLRLPLRVIFTGEIGQDLGGVRRELFTIAIRDLQLQTNVLGSCANGTMLWFKEPLPSRKSMKRSAPDESEDLTHSEQSKEVSLRDYKHSLEFYLGLLVGIAAYNGIHVDIPFPPCIYKHMKGNKLELEDLWAADSTLARSMQVLLDFEEGEGSMEDVFQITFTASHNPLLAQHSSDTNSSENYCELIAGGADTRVNRSNRKLFVEKFIDHTLSGCVQNALNEYFAGLRLLFSGPAVDLCSYMELERILCGSKTIGDLSELRINTHYKGSFHDEDELIQWFWNFLSKLSNADKRRFLHFVTGSEHVPLGGISNVGLTIQSTEQEDAALPTTHTCFSILNISNKYKNAEQLEERFHVALQHHHGFGLI